LNLIWSFNLDIVSLYRYSIDITILTPIPNLNPLKSTQLLRLW